MPHSPHFVFGYPQTGAGDSPPSLLAPLPLALFFHPPHYITQQEMASSLTKALDPKRTLLLICDVQTKFREATYGFSDMCSAIRKMTKAATILEMPVMATEQNPKALGETVPDVGLAEVPSELLLGAHPKTKFSMCISPVQEAIKDKNIDAAIIVGIESHICVLQTTLDLLASDLRVFVLADAVSSVHKQEIPVALEVMRQAGAVVTTSESIVFRLMRDASDPKFKPFVKLIKEEKDAGNTKRALETFLGGAAEQGKL
ncbi:Isochorismatase hydrolase [Dioszegia hungarica]|uniref:Isochorismatase hydrolase n=1 Tax=Dioszegia hungarica TaxID=4972 RepID=A0AA38H5S7_9TREE|nr:Isochorismatase hydrolase [Dioszegia hungarica]KAI9632989.1 Isochorismatase hydrolase [Dioszegia hungarica]